MSRPATVLPTLLMLAAARTINCESITTDFLVPLGGKDPKWLAREFDHTDRDMRSTRQKTAYAVPRVLLQAKSCWKMGAGRGLLKLVVAYEHLLRFCNNLKDMKSSY